MILEKKTYMFNHSCTLMIPSDAKYLFGLSWEKNRRTDPQGAEELFVILSQKDILAQDRGMFRLRIISVVL